MWPTLVACSVFLLDNASLDDPILTAGAIWKAGIISWDDLVFR